MGHEEMKEPLDRTRRIETKLTKYLENQGFDTRAQKPVFHKDTSELSIPSRNVSLRDCLEAIPAGWEDPIDVYVGDDLVTTIN